MRLRDVLSWGAYFGVLTGILEFAKYKYNGAMDISLMIPMNEQFIWTSALANAMLFILLGLPLFALHKCFPRIITQRVCFAVFVFLCCVDILLAVKSIYAIAAVILSLGLAKITADLVFAKSNALWLQTARWLFGLKPAQGNSPPTEAAGGHRFDVDRRRVLLTSAAAVLGPAVGVNVWLQDQEKRRWARLPAVDPGRPNVLLLVMDTVRGRTSVFTVTVARLLPIWLA